MHTNSQPALSVPLLAEYSDSKGKFGLLQLPSFFTPARASHPWEAGIQLLHASRKARWLRSPSLISCHDGCSRMAITSPQSAQQCVTFIRVLPIKNIIPGALTLDWGAGIDFRDPPTGSNGKHAIWL